MPIFLWPYAFTYVSILFANFKSVSLRLAHTSFWPWKLINSNSNWQIDVVVTTQKKPPTLETSWEFHSSYSYRELENGSLRGSCRYGRLANALHTVPKQFRIPKSKCNWSALSKRNTSLTIYYHTKSVYHVDIVVETEGNEPESQSSFRTLLYNNIVCFPIKHELNNI